MELTSPAFKNNGKIPSKYTCDGKNINPALIITDAPLETKSFVLIMDDPDIPKEVRAKLDIQIWDHWVAFNILADTTEIPEGQNPQGLMGRNTNGNNTYSGPCPPPQFEPKTHRYFFKLFALDSELGLHPGSTKEQVEEAMLGNILAQAVLMGTYSKA